MSYPIKTLSQLPLILKGFRKEKGLTQAAMGEKLGITQQSYASFEANPAAATFERLFTVLRLLGVEIVLEQEPSSSVSGTVASANLTVREPESLRASEIIAPARKKESW
ncbi:helix-turn-helix transcriptional regulator [Propionivibrio limicola]|uniref:helix-turn-helix transcriptional regulator n=1 Tax=Propionivibrio limicola TaxID=167645 RepID=UPI0012921515|nr:helix-turn-helix domain-containing protein [Propionivibrio limicola]